MALRVADSKSQNGREDHISEPQMVIFRATPLQQLIRAVIHAITFGVAYIVMLLGKSGPAAAVAQMLIRPSHVLQRLYHHQHFHRCRNWEIPMRLDGTEGTTRGHAGNFHQPRR